MSNINVISLSGGIGTGKDTGSEIIVRHATLHEQGFRQFSFAKFLYQEIAENFGCTTDSLTDRETKETALPFLQLANSLNKDFIPIAISAISVFRGQPIDLYTELSPRELCKAWGTEFRRLSNFGHDAYWIDKVRDMIVESGHRNWVCSDARHDIERDLLKDFNTLFIRVYRDDIIEDDAAIIATGHGSNVEWRRWSFDAIANNIKGQPSRYLEDLRDILVSNGLSWIGTPERSLQVNFSMKF